MKAAPLKLPPKTTKAHLQKNQPHLYAKPQPKFTKNGQVFQMVVLSAHDL